MTTAGMSVETLDLPPDSRYPDVKAWVYLHRDAAGRVLYVGCSIKPRGRHKQHAARSEWWPQVTDVEVVGPFADVRIGRDREKQLIRSHQPARNIMHTERYVAPCHKRPNALRDAERAVADARRVLYRAERQLAAVRRAAIRATAAEASA